MPISRTYGCRQCGHTWKFLHMTADEPVQPCPQGCMKQPSEGLSAPALNLGAPDRGPVVPQNQGRRETMAADMALKGTGMGDINSHMKTGDIAAKPIRPSDPDAAQVARIAPAITPQFMPAGGGNMGGLSVGLSTVANAPMKNKNLGLVGWGAKTLPRIEQVSTRYRPTKAQ